LGVDALFGLTDVFAQDTQKITQWESFLNKISNALQYEISFSSVVNHNVKAYLIDEFKTLLKSPDISYAVQSTAGGDAGREQLIFERMEKVCNWL